MKTIKEIGTAAMLVALLGGLTACGDMTTRQRDTVVGAGVGAAGGAVIGGRALSVLGGAVVGGVIGNQVGK